MTIIDMLKRAFIVYVRPLLEYNSVVWSPYYKQDIERVQSIFSTRLLGLPTYVGFSTLSAFKRSLQRVNLN